MKCKVSKVIKNQMTLPVDRRHKDENLIEAEGKKKTQK